MRQKETEQTVQGVPKEIMGFQVKSDSGAFCDMLYPAECASRVGGAESMLRKVMSRKSSVRRKNLQTYYARKDFKLHRAREKCADDGD